MKLIRIPKNGSTTLKTLHPEIIMHNLYDYGPLKTSNGSYFRPIIANRAATHIPDKYFINSPYDNEEEKIAIIRNPNEKIISAYNHCCRKFYKDYNIYIPTNHLLFTIFSIFILPLIVLNNIFLGYYVYFDHFEYQYNYIENKKGLPIQNLKIFTLENIDKANDYINLKLGTNRKLLHLNDSGFKYDNLYISKLMIYLIYYKDFCLYEHIKKISQ